MDDIEEITTSAAVPPIVKPFALVRKKFPAKLTGVVDLLRKTKRRVIGNFSKKFSPPLPPKV
jgi:hypothetical protein